MGTQLCQPGLSRHLQFTLTLDLSGLAQDAVAYSCTLTATVGMKGLIHCSDQYPIALLYVLKNLSRYRAHLFACYSVHCRIACPVSFTPVGIVTHHVGIFMSRAHAHRWLPVT